MVLSGRELRVRIGQALVVFVVLLAFQYYRNAVDLRSLLTITVVFLVIVVLSDVLRQRFEE